MKKLLIILCTLISIATISNASVFVRLTEREFDALISNCLQENLNSDSYLTIVEQGRYSMAKNQPHEYFLYKDGFYFRCFAQQKKEFNNSKIAIVPASGVETAGTPNAI